MTDEQDGPRNTSESDNGPPNPESDEALISLVRAGDNEAFGALYQRHSGAALRLARAAVGDADDAEDVVSEAFARVLERIQAGGGPEIAFRPYLQTTVRRLAVDRARLSGRVKLADDDAVFDVLPEKDDPIARGVERELIKQAFASLPERWRAVLWHTEIEGESAAALAPVLGTSPNSVAALAYRAREGLRQAYLQAHVANGVSPGCEKYVDKLAAYVRGSLRERDAAAVEAHLEICDDCRDRRDELLLIATNLRGVLAPVLLGWLVAAHYYGDQIGWDRIAGAGAAGAAGAGAVVTAGSGGTTGAGAAGGATITGVGAGSAGGGTVTSGAGAGAAGKAAATVGKGAAAGGGVNGTTIAAAVVAAAVVTAIVVPLAFRKPPADTPERTPEIAAGPTPIAVVAAEEPEEIIPLLAQPPVPPPQLAEPVRSAMTLSPLITPAPPVAAPAPEPLPAAEPPADMPGGSGLAQSAAAGGQGGERALSVRRAPAYGYHDAKPSAKPTDRQQKRKAKPPADSRSTKPTDAPRSGPPDQAAERGKSGK